MQQINLYPEELRPKPVGLSFPAIGSILLGTALLAALGVWASHAHVEAARERLEAAQDRRQQMQDIVANLRERVESQPDRAEASLLQRAQRLRRLARGRERLLEELGNRGLPASHGFAPGLEALARRSVDGLWLTRIRMAGPALTLTGRAQDAAIVPRYIQALQNAAALAGREFRTLDIARAAEPPDVVTFTLSGPRDEDQAREDGP